MGVRYLGYDTVDTDYRIECDDSYEEPTATRLRVAVEAAVKEDQAPGLSFQIYDGNSASEWICLNNEDTQALLGVIQIALADRQRDGRGPIT